MKYTIVRDDISLFDADAIVLPANPGLKEGSGTSSAGTIVENTISQIDFRFKANSEIEEQITIDIENLRKQIGIIDKILENKVLEKSIRSFLIDIKTSFTDAKEMKEHLKTSLEAYMLNVYHNVRKSLDEVSERIKSIDYDELFQNQMEDGNYQ